MASKQLATGNYLKAGELPLGQELTSSNGSFKCALQETGDMVICRTSDKQVVWASGTKDSKAVKAVLKKDGNFGLQDADGAEKWSSKTNGCGDCFVVMQDNGNLVIYNDDDVAVWSSNTCHTEAQGEKPPQYEGYYYYYYPTTTTYRRGGG